MAARCEQFDCMINGTTPRLLAAIRLVEMTEAESQAAAYSPHNEADHGRQRKRHRLPGAAAGRVHEFGAGDSNRCAIHERRTLVDPGRRELDGDRSTYRSPPFGRRLSNPDVVAERRPGAAEILEDVHHDLETRRLRCDIECAWRSRELQKIFVGAHRDDLTAVC